MGREPRDYIKEVEEMLSIPKPLRELLDEDKVGVMEKLFGFLNFDNVMQRKATAYALGQIGDPWAIEQLELRLQSEQFEGVQNAIKAAIATLKKMPADKGYSDLERRKYIADAYWGRVDDKPDVNEWQWKSEKADEIFDEGIKAVLKAIMLRKMKGLKDPAVQSEIKGYLEKAISQIEKVLSIEQPPHPLLYKYLTMAYAELGTHLFYIDESTINISPVTKSLFDKAKVNAEKAYEIYEQTTGWDPGSRFDFHISIAQTHFLNEEFEKAQKELDKAKSYQNESSGFIEEARFVAMSLEKIRNAGISKSDTPKRAETKSGCLSIIAIFIIVSLVIILLSYLIVFG